jgi:hypothetical protein
VIEQRNVAERELRVRNGIKRHGEAAGNVQILEAAIVPVLTGAPGGRLRDLCHQDKAKGPISRKKTRPCRVFEMSAKPRAARCRPMKIVISHGS